MYGKQLNVQFRAKPSLVCPFCADFFYPRPGNLTRPRLFLTEIRILYIYVYIYVYINYPAIELKFHLAQLTLSLFLFVWPDSDIFSKWAFGFRLCIEIHPSKN